MTSAALYAQQPVIDKLVFGTYYGRCTANCVNIYQVDNTSLQKDDSAKYGSANWAYYFTSSRTLPPAKYALAKDLLHQVPLELLSKNRVTIGCPDCHDQGGIFIDIMSGPIFVKFKLDIEDTPDQSAAVVAFKQKLLAVVKQLL